MKTLKRKDIELAAYVAQFGAWKGMDAPGRNETPSGLVREAMGFAEKVKALRADMLKEERELAQTSSVALASELLGKNLEGGEHG
jgi:hypothetical protein